MATTYTTGIASTNQANNVGTVTAGQTASGIAQKLGQTPAQFLTNNPNFAAKGSSNDYKGLTGNIAVGQNYNLGNQSTTALSSDKTSDIANNNNVLASYEKKGVTTDPNTGVLEA